ESVPMQLHVLDGPPGVSVTTMPTTTTVSVPTGYTVYSPTREPIVVKSASEVDAALASVADKAQEPTMEVALDVLRKQVAAHPTLNTALALALLDQAEGKPRDTQMPQRLTTIDQQIFRDLLASLDNLNNPALPTA